MKKISVIILLLSIFLFSCSKRINAQYVHTGWDEGTHALYDIVNSETQLASYTAARDISAKSYLTAIEKYNSSFFEKNTLVIFNIEASSGSYTYKVSNYTINNDEITIYIKLHSPEIADCMMSGWHIFLEISKDEMNGVNYLNYSFDEKNINKGRQIIF